MQLRAVGGTSHAISDEQGEDTDALHTNAFNPWRQVCWRWRFCHAPMAGRLEGSAFAAARCSCRRSRSAARQRNSCSPQRRWRVCRCCRRFERRWGRCRVCDGQQKRSPASMKMIKEIRRAGHSHPNACFAFIFSIASCKDQRRQLRVQQLDHVHLCWRSRAQSKSNVQLRITASKTLSCNRMSTTRPQRQSPPPSVAAGCGSGCPSPASAAAGLRPSAAAGLRPSAAANAPRARQRVTASTWTDSA